MTADSSPIGCAIFPSATQIQFQCFVGGLLGRPIALSELTEFATRSRSVRPELTERASMVLHALSRAHRPLSARELPLKPTVLWVVLRGLHDLGFIEVTGDKFREVVSLTDTGRALVLQAGTPVNG